MEDPRQNAEWLSNTFGLLPEPEVRATSFAQSLAVNAAIAGLLLWFSITQFHKASAPSYYVNELVFLKPPPAIPVIHIKARTPIVTQTRPSRISLPKPTTHLPKPEFPALKTPAPPDIPLLREKQVVAAPQPKVGMFAAAQAVTLANDKNTMSVKSGGFGDPSGVAVHSNANNAPTIAAVGSFNNAVGANQGPRKRPGSRGTIQSGGFASSSGAVGQAGVRHGAIADTGFGNANPANANVQPATPQQSMMTPPQVLSEPRPQYTDEAKQMRIQGEVTLQVRFGIDGQVKVLRIVNSLGHGLDEEAKKVAEQIQFKPATKNGQPSDNITYIHILFQLA